jgi:hypothetical protein
MATRRGRRLARLGQALLRVRTRRLEQAVTRLDVVGVGDHQRLVAQSRQAFDDVDAVALVPGRDGPGGRERERTGEYAQPEYCPPGGDNSP